ncbi:MAG: ribonuclease PH [bacterium]
MRSDGRGPKGIRPVKFERHFQIHAEGSNLIEMGNTKVVCAVSMEDKVPQWMKGGGEGWVTAEYGMLPRATHDRKPREVSRGRVEGRTAEIQRLIGRSLRSAVNMKALGERTLWVDADVIQADGGTRTASITGSFVALVDAIRWMKREKIIDGRASVIRSFVAAVSVGVVGKDFLLDLTYEEDSSAEVDLNVVMTDKGEIIDVAGTGEKRPFTRAELDRMLAVAWEGIEMLFSKQRDALGLANGDLP